MQAVVPTMNMPGLDPFSRHGGYLELELGLASGYIEGRDPCPDYIII